MRKSIYTLILLACLLVPGSVLAQSTTYLPLITTNRHWPDGSIREHDPLGMDVFNLPMCDVAEINATIVDNTDFLPSYFTGKVNVLVDSGSPKALISFGVASGSPDFTSRSSVTP